MLKEIEGKAVGAVAGEVAEQSLTQQLLANAAGTASQQITNAAIKKAEARGWASAQEGEGFFKGLWKKTTAWHFEERHANNGQVLSMDVAEEQGFYGGVPADYHQDGAPGDEIKLVHSDGREMIYDGVTGQPIGMERAGIMGTYNYVSMPEMPAAGAGIWANMKFGASFVVRGVGHGVADVLPYKVLGGNVRGSECSVNNCAP